MDMSLSKLQKVVKDREACPWGHKELDVTEWKTTNMVSTTVVIAASMNVLQLEKNTGCRIIE